MPYTLAHPGFSLYLFRKLKYKVGTTGLVVGSIFPDTDILFRISNSRFHIYQYGLFDVFVIMLPLSLLTGIFFHEYIKPVLFKKVHIQPLNLSKELLDFNYWQWFKRNYFKEILGILLAIYLHIFLDMISHWNAWYLALATHLTIHPTRYFFDVYYYFYLYFPVVLFTLVGFFFFYKYLNSVGVSISSLITSLVETLKRFSFFWLLFGLFVLLLSIIKIQLSGYEPGFEIDYLAISLTSGLILAFFTFPLIYNTFEQIKFKFSKK